MTLRTKNYSKENVASNRVIAETQRRIDAQAALVAKLQPGTEHHRIATDILLALADSMHLLIEAQRLLRQIDAQEKFWLANPASPLVNPASNSN